MHLPCTCKLLAFHHNFRHLVDQGARLDYLAGLFQGRRLTGDVFRDMQQESKSMPSSTIKVLRRL
jgi:hypothetical protein